MRRVASFVASELGVQAAPLLDDVIQLTGSDDRRLINDALEVVVVYATGKYADRLVVISQALESNDEVIRVLAMRLPARASGSQTAAAGVTASEVHRRGLEMLSAGDACCVDAAQRMLNDEDPVARMYGAIVVKRLEHRNPELLQLIMREEGDTGVRRFARERL